MLLLSLLLPPLIISLPQSLSKLSHIPSTLKSAYEHLRSSPPATPINSTAPIEGIPVDVIPEPIQEPVILEPLKPAYAPLLFAGRDAWRAFSEDPAGAWETGDREHVWFFWFSGVQVDAEGAVGPPLVEGTEWPELGEGENVDKEFEVRRRKLEVGLFSGDKNDEVYRDTAISISKQQQQEQFEQEQVAHQASVSSTSTSTKTSSVDPIIFSSESPVAPPSSYAHFAFVNCNDEEERPLCYKFLAIKEHRPMLFAVTRNTTIIETLPEPEVSPLVPGFVHMEEHDAGMTQQLGDDAVVHVEAEEEKAMDEDPVVEEAVDATPEPPQLTIVHKLVLRRVPLKDNLTTTDLHNFYEFSHWEKLSAWDDVLNPADGLIGAAMDGRVGEFIGLGYEYWYKTPKWAFGVVLGLFLQWITVTILERSHQKREKKKAQRAQKEQKRVIEVAAAAAVEVAQIPLKAQVILPEVPQEPEKPVETHVPEEIEVVEHAELAKAEEVASIAEVLDKAEVGEDVKPEIKSEVKDEVKVDTKAEANGETNGEANGKPKDHVKSESQALTLEDKASMEDI